MEAVKIKIQKIKTAAGKRYLLIDSDYKVVDEVRRYLQYLDHCGRSPNTLRSYALDLLLYYRYLEEQGIDAKDIGNMPDKGPIDILSGFMFWLQYPMASRGILSFSKERPVRTDRTVNRIMSTILGFYEFLARNKELKELDAYRAQRTSGQFKSFLYELVLHRKELKKTIFYKKNPNKKVEALTREDYMVLFKACRSMRDRLFLALLFECGLRIGEAAGVHLEDLLIEENEMRIVPRENNENGARVKNYAKGIVILPPYTVDLLIDYLMYERPESASPFLFLTANVPGKAHPISMSAAKRIFERLSARTGIRVHAHMLRHGFAQEKLDAGWTLEQVQAYLRHRQVTSTQIYAQYTDDSKRENMRHFLEHKKELFDNMGTLAENKEGINE